ncbi:MAG: lamin tail domain-containing protein [Trueperaceae bacterium]|nr:lamin tail domain-containing protein [Trueperaceae bacterium]
MKATIHTCILLALLIGIVSCSQGPRPAILRLEMAVIGLGKGSITGEALTKACTDSCTSLFQFGDSVTLKAVAAPGSSFVAWEGACTGTGACQLNLDNNTEVRAIFEPNGSLLKLELSGSGKGKILSQSGNLNCSEACEVLFGENEKISLVAEALPGSSFVAWEGACTGAGSCELSMNNSKLLGARFEALASNEASLQITRLGNGSGKVSAAGTNLNCGNTCYEVFAKNSAVTLVAEALPGSSFIGWQGACSGSGPCNLNLTENAQVSAEFSRPAQGDLVINELASAPRGESVWLELFNASNATLDLSDYQLRAQAIQGVVPYAAFGEVRFKLPARPLAPGEYMVLLSKGAYWYTNGPKHAYLSGINSSLPYWANSGFVELLRNNQTVDFVRFGNDQTKPLSPEIWGSMNAPALNLQRYGSSLVRKLDNKEIKGSSWRISQFETPAGANDIPENAADTDGDGIPDSAEIPGGSFAGLPLYEMGARLGQKDIFVEIDHMESSDEGILPRREALDKIVAAFAKQGIGLHFDVGTYFSEDFSPISYNLGAGNSSVPFAASIVIPSSSYSLKDKANFYDYKARYMDLRRRPLFHYLLMANSMKDNGLAGPSGLAEMNGNDLIVTLGKWNLNSSSLENTNMLINFQASTIMHELGHNLGLRHGGHENDNYKPNYYSIMNYQYQLYGLGSSTGDYAAERYYAFKNYKGFGKDICKLSYSPCGPDFIIDYSSGSSAKLNENGLLETLNLGQGHTWFDFDNNGVENRPSLDVNNDNKLAELEDFDDWSNIVIPFQCGFNGTNLRSQSEHTLSPLSQDVQEWITEELHLP